jgi:hypothetical protein
VNYFILPYFLNSKVIFQIIISGDFVMSNTIPNTAAYDVEPVDVECTVCPETEVETTPETEQPQPKKKTFFPRLIGALLAIASIAIVFLNVQVIVGAATVETTLLKAIQDLLASDNKLFGALPALADTAGVAGQIATISLYVFALCLVLSVLFGIITVFNPKALRATVFFFSVGFFTYVISIFATSKENVLDIIYLGAAAFGVLVYLVLAFAKCKKAGVALFQLILTLVVYGAIAYATTNYYAEFTAGLESLGLAIADTVLLAVLLVLAFNLFISYIALQAKICKGINVIRAILQFVIAAAVVYLAIAGKGEMTFLIIAIAATVVALLQLVLSFGKCKKKEKIAIAEPVVEEVEEEVEEEPEFIREEYAEALPYEGGPVEGVEIAEEVNPTFVAPPPQVQTAGYDFFNCKSFDPFIAMLNEQERNQFTELFILKYKGVMPEIPDYAVGGDNKEFFHKLFIYLGQYRDRIPNELLSKIYQFAIKM